MGYNLWLQASGRRSLLSLRAAICVPHGNVSVGEGNMSFQYSVCDSFGSQYPLCVKLPSTLSDP
jgi:hypothetical protein